jgi:hypothetical protein
MDRRGLLKMLGLIVGGIAVEQAIPFGRVWSFPKDIKCLNVDRRIQLRDGVNQIRILPLGEIKSFTIRSAYEVGSADVVMGDGILFVAPTGATLPKSPLLPLWPARLQVP